MGQLSVDTDPWQLLKDKTRFQPSLTHAFAAC